MPWLKQLWIPAVLLCNLKASPPPCVTEDHSLDLISKSGSNNTGRDNAKGRASVRGWQSYSWSKTKHQINWVTRAVPSWLQPSSLSRDAQNASDQMSKIRQRCFIRNRSAPWEHGQCNKAWNRNISEQFVPAFWSLCPYILYCYISSLTLQNYCTEFLQY